MKRAGLSCLLILGSCQLGMCQTARSDEWQPAKGPLLTRWAADVSPDNVWPEYPRPQLVRDDWTNLNGLWDYAIQPKDAGRPNDWDGRILVPFPVESALSGVMKKVKPNQRLWYRRQFSKPELREDGRLLLHFGAVDWDTSVWVNGKRVGVHRGGYDPFTIDITDTVKNGQNELVLAVWDPTDTGYQPRGKQVLKPRGIWYTAVTGIWQTVWLEPVPADYIKSLKIVPDVDRGVVSVTVDTTRRVPVQLAVQLSALDGDTVIATQTGRTGDVIELAIDNARLWTPEQPNLYDLKVRLIQGNETVDAVGSYFGMRKIHVAKDDQGVNRLLLNNKVVFQYGPLDQGWWPDGLYTPASDDAIKYDINMTKKFGMNMARKHVKYECARWYYWCDKLGLLVWQDMPSGDSARSAESKANFRSELNAMINALRHFPSIVMWVPFNEGWGQYDTAEVVAWLQQYDPTRPVNETSGWDDCGSGDVSDSHSYPGPGMRAVEADRVVVLGEFGGLGMPVARHTWQEEANWGYVSYKTAAKLTDTYVELLARMRMLIGRGLSAAVYTQTSDVEIEVNGLMTYDRKVVKMDLKRIADAAGKLHLPTPIVKTLVPTSQDQPQTWKYTFEQPVADWFKAGFDDARWKSGPGGFGSEGTPGVVIGTAWKSSDIWLRRSFQLDDIPKNGTIGLAVCHDEDAEVYINGKLVKTFKKFVGYYVFATLDASAKAALRTGENTIAVHCHQTRGGQGIDVGLVWMTERD